MYNVGKKVDILAVTLDRHFFKRKRDILLVTCYIPPANSSYLKKIGNKDPFNDLITLLGEVEDKFDCILCGDFNSRCKSIEDFNLCTEIPGLSSEADYDIQQMRTLERNNRDKASNTYTTDFMDLSLPKRISPSGMGDRLATCSVNSLI